MLHATELLGSMAYDAQGNFVGRVKEFYLEPADQGNRVSRFLLARGKFQPLIARHDQVGFVAAGTMRLTVGETELETFHPNDSWLAVRKDLLDQQIIDTQGRKVVRVNDLDMVEHRANSHVDLRITRVDVGLQGAAGRLLQGLATSSFIRRVQEKLPSRVIPWEFVNLIEPDPMRRVKLRLTSNRLTRMHPADLAELMGELSPAERNSIIETLDEAVAAEVLAELDKRLQTQVFEGIPPEKAADILEEMQPDEAADVLADLPPERSRQVLREMPRREAAEVRELLQYEPDTAGGMMTTDLIEVGEDATRGEVVDYIRYHEVPLEQLDSVILINRDAAFTGTVPVSRLLLAGDSQKMTELVAESALRVEPAAEEKEVFELFDKYNLRSLTVVDKDAHPIGTIAVDDIISRMHAKLG